MPAVQIFRKCYVLAVVFLLYVSFASSVPAELHDYYPHPAHKAGECPLVSDQQIPPVAAQGRDSATSDPATHNTDRATTTQQPRSHVSYGVEITSTATRPPSGQEVTTRPSKTATGRATPPPKDVHKVVENGYLAEVGFWTGQEGKNRHPATSGVEDPTLSSNGTKTSQGNQGGQTNEESRGQISLGNQGEQVGKESQEIPQDTKNNAGQAVQGGQESQPRQAGQETEPSQGQQVTTSWQVTQGELTPAARGDQLSVGGQATPDEQVPHAEQVTQAPQWKVDRRTQMPAERVTSPGYESGDWPPLPSKPGREEAVKPCSSTHGCSTGVGGTVTSSDSHHRPPVVDDTTTPDTEIPRDPEARRDYMREVKKKPSKDAPLPDARSARNETKDRAKNVVVDQPSEHVEGVDVMLGNADIYLGTSASFDASTTSKISTEATADRGGDSSGASGSVVGGSSVDDRSVFGGRSDGGSSGGGIFDGGRDGSGMSPSTSTGGEHSGVGNTGRVNFDGGNVPSGSVGSKDPDSANLGSGSIGSGSLDGASIPSGGGGSKGTDSGNTGSGDVVSGSLGSGRSGSVVGGMIGHGNGGAGSIASGSVVGGMIGHGNGGAGSIASGSSSSASSGTRAGNDGTNMDGSPFVSEPHTNIPSDPEERRKYLQKVGSRKPSDPFSRKIFVMLRDGLLPSDPVQRKRFLEQSLYI